MTEASKLNIQVTTGEQPKKVKRKSFSVRKTRPPMMEEVINWICSMNLSPEVKEQLVNKAKKYPLEAMNRFRDKVLFHIQEIQKNIHSENYTKEEDE